MDLNGLRLLVTGGASGLGLATAKRFVSDGSSAALLDLPNSQGAEIAESLGESATFVPADVTDSDQVADAINRATEEMGTLHVVVNAAGVGPAFRVRTRDGDLFPLDLFRFVVNVNLIGTFDVVRRVADVMATNEPNEDGERGVIVNVASIAAFEGQVGQAAYSASKGGVAAMTLPLARDLASYGIRVVTIAPGVMRTPLLAGLKEEATAALEGAVPFPKRLGRAAEFAQLVVEIVKNPYLNAEVIRLDGGLRMAAR